MTTEKRQKGSSSPTAIASAQHAGLRYVMDDRPGISRETDDGAVVYLDLAGSRIQDEPELQRIRSLMIPPAWTNVWINPIADGHLQATGRDARGRKQYRYHPQWAVVRDESKFAHVLTFGQVLPLIRAQVVQDLELPGLPRAKVLATVVRLLETTLIRIGNEEYARQNHSFGLTTLTDDHVDVQGELVRFHFRGKSGKVHEIGLRDMRLAAIVKDCQDLPGHELFQYVDNHGRQHVIESGDINAYLHGHSGEYVTAKDYRTWAATIYAVCELSRRPASSSLAAKQGVAQAVKAVSQRLGNTPAVCRRAYIHPAVITAYLGGRLLQIIEEAPDPRLSLQELHDQELAIIRFLTMETTAVQPKN